MKSDMKKIGIKLWKKLPKFVKEKTLNKILKKGVDIDTINEIYEDSSNTPDFINKVFDNCIDLSDNEDENVTISSYIKKVESNIDNLVSLKPEITKNIFSSKSEELCTMISDYMKLSDLQLSKGEKNADIFKLISELDVENQNKVFDLFAKEHLIDKFILGEKEKVKFAFKPEVLKNKLPGYFAQYMADCKKTVENANIEYTNLLGGFKEKNGDYSYANLAKLFPYSIPSKHFKELEDMDIPSPDKFNNDLGVGSILPEPARTLWNSGIRTQYVPRQVDSIIHALLYSNDMNNKDTALDLTECAVKILDQKEYKEILEKESMYSKYEPNSWNNVYGYMSSHFLFNGFGVNKTDHSKSVIKNIAPILAKNPHVFENFVHSFESAFLTDGSIKHMEDICNNNLVDKWIESFKDENGEMDSKNAWRFVCKSNLFSNSESYAKELTNHLDQLPMLLEKSVERPDLYNFYNTIKDFVKNVPKDMLNDDIVKEVKDLLFKYYDLKAKSLNDRASLANLEDKVVDVFEIMDKKYNNDVADKNKDTEDIGGRY